MKRTVDTPRGTILVREANAADAARFRELRLEALRTSPIAFSADYQKISNHSQKYWEDLLTPQPDETTMFIAEREGRLIGMTGVMRSNSPKTRHAVWIWGVYVTPEWRGLHLAQELVLSCLEWAKARKAALAKLGVAVVNEPAIRCYERCGFSKYGTEPRAILYEGNYYDEYLMSIDLDNH